MGNVRTYPNPYAQAWAQFSASTATHRLAVLRDDGLYRHLRMAVPGTGIWSWEVVTWPWHLYVGGDIGMGYTFSREADMLAFMDTSGYGDYHGDGSPLLQADYWAEKLSPACRDSASRYSPEKFLRRVEEAIQDRTSGLDADHLIDEGWARRAREGAQEVADDEYEARQWLVENWFADAWEFDLKAFDHHYLLALYAIQSTIRALKAAGEQGGEEKRDA